MKNKLSFFAAPLLFLTIGFYFAYSLYAPTNKQKTNQSEVLSEKVVITEAPTLTPLPTLTVTPTPRPKPKISSTPTPIKESYEGCTQRLVNAGYFGYSGWSDQASCDDFAKTKGSGKNNPTPVPVYGGGYRSNSTYNPIHCSSYSIGTYTYTNCY